MCHLNVDGSQPKKDGHLHTRREATQSDNHGQNKASARYMLTALIRTTGATSWPSVPAGLWTAWPYFAWTLKNASHAPTVT